MGKDLKFIFVHGLSGWGSYDKQYKKMPYWGMRSGDLIKQLNDVGFKTYAASVAPHSSAHDRASELYGQLTGTRVDYGQDHSNKFNHKRYGKDYSDNPLINNFPDSKLVLIGHSFGGATIRMFSKLLDEKNLINHIFAIITIASPHNGTTAYDMYEDNNFDPYSYKFSLK